MKLFLFRTLIAAAVGASLLTGIKTPYAMMNTASQNFHDAVKPDRLNGVWRSRGYGWLLAVENGLVHIYDENTRTCITNEDLSGKLHDLDDGFQISSNGQVIRLPLGDASYSYTFDKINGLPEICRNRPDSGPNSVFESFIDIFTRHYAFFATRKIDWPALADASRKTVNANTTNEELLGILRNMISQFDDDHVSLEAEIDGEEVVLNTGAGVTLGAVAALAARKKVDGHALLDHWQRRLWQKDIGETLLRGNGRTAANGKIKYGFIDGRIGYLAIRSMGDLVRDETDDESAELKAADRAMDGAMALFKGAEAIIVDVAINDGGFDTVARRFAGRFAAKRTLGYYKYAGDSKGDRPQAIYVEPSKKRRFTGPVYLLTSDVTVSAAEIFTMSMDALPNVTHVGGTTRGALSDQLWKSLPNGWWLSLSNEVYLDAEHKSWEGSGIPPQVPLEVFSVKDVSAGHLKAVRAVVDMARSKKPIPVSRRQ